MILSEILTTFLLQFILLFSISKASGYNLFEFNSISNEDLYHVTTHNTTGDIYIGAHNALYRLSEYFTIIANTSTCSPTDTDCNNINKVLAIDYDHDRLITCGGGNNGRCEARSLVDLSFDGINFVEEIVSGLSAVGIVAPAVKDSEKKNVLYISSGHTSLNPLDYYTYINSKRSLETSSLFKIIQYVDGQGNSENRNIMPVDKYKAENRRLDFKSAFVYEDYTYFTAFRQDDISLKHDELFHSRLSRVCHNSSFLTFSEIYLRCVNTVDYNIVQSMSVGPIGTHLSASLGLQAEQDVLYGVFAKGDDDGHPRSQSALCVYKWDDIEDAFFKALNGCLTESAGMKPGGDQLAYAGNAECDNVRIVTANAWLNTLV